MHIDPLIIPIAAFLIPIVIVPTTLVMKYKRHARELEHAERIRALELGRTLPKDESRWSAARMSLAFGVKVPVAVFFFALAAYDARRADDAPWVAAGIVGLASVISGALLAHRHLGRNTANYASYGDPFAKPHVDADAFDVVSSRG